MSQITLIIHVDITFAEQNKTIAMSVQVLTKAPMGALHEMGLGKHKPVHFQLPPAELTEQTLARGEGTLSEKGALVISTGKFTGRSPKDKFTVKDEITADTVDWNKVNLPIEEKFFFQLKEKLISYLSDKEIWVRDCFACADIRYRLHLRVINEILPAIYFAIICLSVLLNRILKIFIPIGKSYRRPVLKQIQL